MGAHWWDVLGCTDCLWTPGRDVCFLIFLLTTRDTAIFLAMLGISPQTLFPRNSVFQQEICRWHLNICCCESSPFIWDCSPFFQEILKDCAGGHIFWYCHKYQIFSPFFPHCYLLSRSALSRCTGMGSYCWTKRSLPLLFSASTVFVGFIMVMGSASEHISFQNPCLACPRQVGNISKFRKAYRMPSLLHLF